jgi:endonuclease/exonuclease/phosphatase family metal-dependent hydrolase
MPSVTNYALNVGTFNTQLVSWIFQAGKDPLALVTATPWGWLSDFDAAQVAKATAIADRILHGTFEYDIIALNEVFHEDARDALVDALKGTFPFYVRKSPAVAVPVPAPLLSLLPGPLRSLLEMLTPGATLDLEDSGLMLFSRFPIAATAFAEFDLPFGEGLPDSLAAKGALYARIMNIRSGRPLHVVATHLHEDKDDWADLRALELNQIESLIVAQVGSAFGREDVIILGDINVIANLTPNASAPDGVPARAEKDEYRQRFSDEGPPNFFSVMAHDTWARHTSARDRGASTLGGNRLDLILHNEGDRLLVPQQLTLGWNLCAPAGEPLSDHLAVNAEFNHDAPLCNPRRAAAAALETWTPGRIRYPAAMEWYRVDDPGTYAFAVLPTEPASGTFTVTVYGNSDLSRPLAQYRGETTETIGPNQEPVSARTFVLTKPPYYIRVRHDFADRVGDYVFWVHRRRGQSKAEAIVLVPSVTTVAAFPKGEPLNSDDTLWFRLDLDAADSGHPQHIEIVAWGQTSAKWTAALVAGDGTTALGSWAPARGSERQRPALLPRHARRSHLHRPNVVCVLDDQPDHPPRWPSRFGRGRGRESARLVLRQRDRSGVGWVRFHQPGGLGRRHPAHPAQLRP